MANLRQLEALLKVSAKRTVLETQRLRTEFEGKLLSEQSAKEDLRRRVEEYLSDLSRLMPTVPSHRARLSMPLAAIDTAPR
jgi:hypothetical protein